MEQKKEKVITAYKGFDKNLKCRGFQYEICKEYEIEGDIKVCERGFHACPNPANLFSYYFPNESRYCEVELSGIIDDSENDKLCASRIKIARELTPTELVAKHKQYVEAHLVDDDEHKASNTGDYSSASNTGNRSSASNTGNRSSASNTGDCSGASNTGNRSSASNTGDCSSASNTGDYSSASNTGNYSSASNTGDCSSASNTGNRSSASNTGDCSSASNTGDCSSASNTGNRSSAEVSCKGSCAAVFGKDCKVRGALGCALFLVERGDWNGETYPILNVKAVIVDGETVKADTWYMLKNGELVEV